MGSVCSDTAPPEGYMFMNNSRPTSANSFNQTDSGQFDFQFSPKLRKVDEETTNSVEMRPMLTHPAGSPIQLVNGFSNPNYQNPPAIKCSDLDDLPLTVKTKPTSIVAGPNYINIADPPVNGEEDHYVSPKNNSRLVWCFLNTELKSHHTLLLAFIVFIRVWFMSQGCLFICFH